MTMKNHTIMKNCLWMLLLIPMAIGMTGCDLQEEPKATATKDAVFNSEKGLELYATSFYNILPTANNIHRGDEMADYSAKNGVSDLIRKNALTSRQGSGWDWTQLRNINYFITNCNDPHITPEATRHYLGLARFFRALFYFEKVKRFGDVPWINKAMTVDDPDLYAGRDKRTLVMDSVLADLNYASANIRTTTDASRSLITKYVVYAFKSRICLFEGTFRRYHTTYGLTASAEKWLKAAADAAQQVMTGGGFSINEAGGPGKSYRQLFTSKAPVASEIILSAVIDPALGVFNDANWYWTSATYGARISFTRTFVNTYLNLDGTPFTSKPGYETMTFLDETQNRDTRLQQTIRLGSYQRTNAGKSEAAPPVFSYTYTGYQPIKWTLDDVSYDGGAKNDNSISIIRYAEVLLNYAEAKAELGTMDATDWTRTVGALRKRAGITGGLNAIPTVIDPYMQSNYFPKVTDAALIEIRRERGIELALEGLRFYDLVRWKHGELMLKPWNGFYVPALDQPMDLNGDGIKDVVFVKTVPATPVKGLTYVNVAETISGGVNPQRLSNDTYGEIIWLNNIERAWPANGKKYLYPIPETDLLMNENLRQNPWWDTAD